MDLQDAYGKIFQIGLELAEIIGTLSGCQMVFEIADIVNVHTYQMFLIFILT